MWEKDTLAAITIMSKMADRAGVSRQTTTMNATGNKRKVRKVTVHPQKFEETYKGSVRTSVVANDDDFD